MPPSVLRVLQTTSERIDRFHQLIGSSLAWLSLVMAVVVAIIITTRIFHIGSIALQESVTYMHATLFLLCLGFAGINGAHVRVDIFYRRQPKINNAWVNLVGALLFLLPFSVFLTGISIDTALASWQIREASINAGGLPLVFILKSLPPLAGVLLFTYAISEICKNLVAVSVIGEQEVDSEKLDD